MKSVRNSGKAPLRGLDKKSGEASSKANAAGYERRRARKAQSHNLAADVYEHVQEKSRRSNVAADLDRDEAFEFGGVDDISEDQRQSLRARLIGENEDDEEIASGDDEELDSDAAFEESDEDRFAGFFSSKKAHKQRMKPIVRFADVDLNEDEDMDSPKEQNSESEDAEEDGEDDEFIDLLDILDGKGEMFTGSDEEGSSKSTAQRGQPHERPAENDDDADHDEHSEDTSEEGSPDEDEDEEMDFAPSEGEDGLEALDQLQNFVSGLETTSRKRKQVDDDHENTQRVRKRRTIKERTEAGEENEFRVQSTGTKLNLDDLLAPLGAQSSALQSLKKSTKVLSSSSSKNRPLSAPLPQRAQERLDREAAYEQTKEEVDKWSETMKRIREAEHLSFPLQAPSKARVSNLELSAKFKPTNDFERAIEALTMKAEELEDDPYGETALEMNNLSIDEVAQRRGELRKMRELMFRAEIKSRRVSKIKSKAYRRIRRKEKERLGEKINDRDAEDDSETEEGKMKRELERAKERATLRHKHTGKWARQMKSRGELNQESRRDVEEMLSRGEKLRRRIQGVGSDESEGAEDEDEDEDNDLDAEGSLSKIKQDAFNELAGLDQVPDEGGEQQKGKSVFEMKFMKDAMARQAAAANKEVDDFIKEMGGEMEVNSDAGEGVNHQDPTTGVVARRAGGRIVFRPGTTSMSISKSDALAAPPSDTSSVTLQSTDLLEPPLSTVSVTNSLSLLSSSNAKESNPWLVREDAKASKAAKKANSVVVGKDSKTLDKSKHKIKKRTQKLGAEKEKQADDAIVEITMDNVLKMSSNQPSQSQPKTSPPEISKDVEDEDDESLDSEVEAQEQAVIMKGKEKANGLKAFEQRDLVSLAFAGDNVVQSFEDAKRREIETDAPREVDTTIPGWGAWGGAGVRKAPPKPQRIKKVAGIDPTTRADYGKKNIIISEKRDKKAAKYLVKDLPFPYTSKAQFERAMERPLGVEWNTRQGFQRGTLPKVVKKPGIIIEPLVKHS